MTLYNNLDNLRENLISELYETSKLSFVQGQFNQNFSKFIEKVILSLMEGQNSFFALFTIQMSREVKMNIETAVVSNLEGAHFTLYFNPWIFLNCTIKEMQALLKHEVYHILNLHHLRARELSKKYSSLAVALAMDISINQFIINLPVWSESLESVKLSYNVDLKEQMTLEQYCSAIQKALNNLKLDAKSNVESSGNEAKDTSEESIRFSAHNIEGAHKLWHCNANNMNRDHLRETTKKMVSNAIKGNHPDSIKALISNLNPKPEIQWQDYLKKLLGTLPSGHKKTIMRKDRRQPDRLDLRGKLSTHIAEITVAIDISGSVTDKEIDLIMKELLSIVKNYPYKLTIIECDSEIRRIYEVKGIKDIKQKLNTKGSTKFSPVFKYLKDVGKRNCILIYFTDGLGETELDAPPYHYKTLWVLTGKEENLSLKNPFGIVKKLNNLKPKTTGMLAIEYLKRELSDKRSEWAK